MSWVFIAGVILTLALITACTLWFFRLHRQNDSGARGESVDEFKDQSIDQCKGEDTEALESARRLATATKETHDETRTTYGDDGVEPCDKRMDSMAHTLNKEDKIHTVDSSKSLIAEFGCDSTSQENHLSSEIEFDKGSEVSKSEKGWIGEAQEAWVPAEEEGVPLWKTGEKWVTGNSVENSRSTRGGCLLMDPLVRAEVVIGEATRQLLVETNVTLAQPAIKVRNITAEIRELTTDLILDKVIIQGVLHKQIFFVGEDNIVHHQAEDVPFSTFLDVAGAEPGHNVQVHPIIETVIFTLLTPTLLHQKVVIEFFVKVTETRQLNIQEGTGPLVRVDRVVGDSTKQELIENTVTLANPALKIDDITAEVRNLSVDVIEDKVVIQGVVHKQIFYVGLNNIEYHQGEDVEFSTFVDIPGACPGMDVIVEPTIEFIHFELLDNNTLLQKVVVEFFVKVTESIQINIALGPGALLKLDTVVGERTTQILVESILALDQPAVKVREIVARVEHISTEVIEDKVIIQGIVHKQIFFINEDNLEVHQAENVPFSTFVDLPGACPGMDVRIDPIIETVLFELLNSTSLRQKVVIEFFVKVTESQQLQVELVAPYGPYYF